MPQSGFLFSIAALSVTLVGFSGLLAGLRRDAQRTPLVTYRLRQIPEMALASALIALISSPLADLTRSDSIAIRIASGLALAFTALHMAVLLRRARSKGIPLRWANWVLAGLIDIAVLAVGITALISATATAYEWLLVLVLARPAIAFVIALTDVMAD